MILLASYTTDESPAIELRDIETQALVVTIPAQPESRRSMRWIAEQWVESAGHSIGAWDRSNLSNGEVAR